MHRQEGNSGISDRAFAWLLGVSLVLGALTNYSPVLHLVLRHGSLDLAEVHLHVDRQTSHPLQTLSAQQEAAPLLTDTGETLPQPSKAPEGDGDSPQHQHHGLPELLLAGMLEVVETELPAMRWEPGRLEHAFSSESVVAVSSLDPVSAPRPPPILAATFLGSL